MVPSLHHKHTMHFGTEGTIPSAALSKHPKIFPNIFLSSAT